MGDFIFINNELSYFFINHYWCPIDGFCYWQPDSILVSLDYHPVQWGGKSNVAELDTITSEWIKSGIRSGETFHDLNVKLVDALMRHIKECDYGCGS